MSYERPAGAPPHNDFLYFLLHSSHFLLLLLLFCGQTRGAAIVWKNTVPRRYFQALQAARYACRLPAAKTQITLWESYHANLLYIVVVLFALLFPLSFLVLTGSIELQQFCDHLCNQIFDAVNPRRINRIFDGGGYPCYI